MRSCVPGTLENSDNLDVERKASIAQLHRRGLNCHNLYSSPQSLAYLLVLDPPCSMPGHLVPDTASLCAEEYAICEHRDFNVVSCSDRRFSVAVSLDLILPDSVLLSNFVIIMGISVSRVDCSCPILILWRFTCFCTPFGSSISKSPFGRTSCVFPTDGNFKEHNSLNLSAMH